MNKKIKRKESHSKEIESLSKIIEDVKRNPMDILELKNITYIWMGLTVE
jgi:hypothetical protein